MTRSRGAFSLVEVVLALGIVGFALLAVIGLLPIGLLSGRASIQETRANHLADQVFASLRGQKFTAVDFSYLKNSITVDLSTTHPLIQLYGTYDGNFVNAPDYFTINVSFRNNPDGLVPGTANEVHLGITSRETGTKPLNYATIIADQ